MNNNEKMVELYGYFDKESRCKECGHFCDGKCELAGKVFSCWAACGKFVEK